MFFWKEFFSVNFCQIKIFSGTLFRQFSFHEKICFRNFLILIVHYDTSAMKRFLTSVSLQHEPKASDVITLVKKTFFRTSIVRNFISRGVKMRISARGACVKPHLRTRSDIQYFFSKEIIFLNFNFFRKEC